MPTQTNTHLHTPAQLLQSWFSPSPDSSSAPTLQATFALGDNPHYELALQTQLETDLLFRIQPVQEQESVPCLTAIRTIENAWNHQRERLLEQLLHDLKGPLASMELFLEMKERFGGAGVDEKSVVPELRSGCRRLDGLLEVHKHSAFLLKSPLTYSPQTTHLGYLLQYEWDSFLISKRLSPCEPKNQPGTEIIVDNVVAKSALRLVFCAFFNDFVENQPICFETRNDNLQAYFLRNVDCAIANSVYSTERIPKEHGTSGTRAGILAARQAIALLTVFGIIVTFEQDCLVFEHRPAVLPLNPKL